MPDSDAGRPPAEVTTFVGRRDDIAQVRGALSTSRLVTLVGPGGVGKTRLAIRVAAGLERALPARAWVDLAAADDPPAVVSAVVAALGLRERTGAQPSDVLLAHLRDWEGLLVLDSCEQVVDAVADLVAGLLAGAPGLRVIATSREPLSIGGEHVHPVRPLHLPGPDDTLTVLRQNDAVALFVARAAAASGGFALTGANRAGVVDVCRRLDGLPLAIELAAVRTRSLSPEQISDRLDDRFVLLTGGRGAAPRQQTLRAAIDWSHELLTHDEQQLFARLGIFAGRFTLDDVQAVCGTPDGPPDLFPVLAALVDKSLVVKDDVGGPTCYRLHETMREYARDRRAATSAGDALADRFAAHYLTRCGAFAVESRHRLLEWMPWVELEIDNLRALLRRSLEPGQDGEQGLALAASLVWFWVTRATGEGVRWLDALLAASDATHPWPLFVRGFLAVQQGDPAVAVPVLARGIDAARGALDRPALAQTLAMGAIAATLVGDRASSARLLAEAGVVADGLGDLGATLMVLQAQAQNGLADGDLTLARTAAAEGIRLSRAGGDVYSLGMMLLNAGFADLRHGELEAAEGRFVEALDVADSLDDRVAQCYLVGGLGACAAGGGKHRRAARLLGAAEALQAEVGGSPHVAMAPALLAAAASAKAGLGAGRYAAEHDAGRALGRKEAVRVARGEEPAAPGAPRPTLSPRETEVAYLVADGLTNKEIGAVLFVSERTVESHVRAVLAKLGFRSRAQIARSMPARG